MFWYRCYEDGTPSKGGRGAGELDEMVTFEEVVDEIKTRKFDLEEVQRLCRRISRLKRDGELINGWLGDSITIQASYFLVQMLGYPIRCNVSFEEEEFIQAVEVLWERFEKEIRLPPPVFEDVPTSRKTQIGETIISLEDKLRRQGEQLRILTEKTSKLEQSLKGGRLDSVESVLLKQSEQLHTLATKTDEYEKSLEGRFGRSRQRLEARVRHWKELEKMVQGYESGLDKEGFSSEVISRLIEIFRSDAVEDMKEILGK